MLEGKIVGFVGGGNMAEALIAGIGGGSSVMVAEPKPERARYLREQYGVLTGGIAELAARADVVVIAVKPQVVDEVLGELDGALGVDRLLISVAAGIPAARFERALPGTPVVRVMPNTPALVGEGMSVIAPGSHATGEHLAIAAELLAATGKVIELPEAQLDAVTAVSGSGPAYFFYLVEAMVDAATSIGLDREVAQQLVVQTAVGAAAMLRSSDQDAGALRQAVTSPGGTTAAGIDVLEQRGARALFAAMISAARDRSVELGTDR